MPNGPKPSPTHAQQVSSRSPPRPRSPWCGATHLLTVPQTWHRNKAAAQPPPCVSTLLRWPSAHLWLELDAPALDSCSSSSPSYKSCTSYTPALKNCTSCSPALDSCTACTPSLDSQGNIRPSPWPIISSWYCVPAGATCPALPLSVECARFFSGKPCCSGAALVQHCCWRGSLHQASSHLRFNTRICTCILCKLVMICQSLCRRFESCLYFL